MHESYCQLDLAWFYILSHYLIGGLHEWKQHKPLFDKECVDFLDHRKQAKMQWIQDTSRSNVDNLNKIRHDASRYFRKKRRHISKLKLRNLKSKWEGVETRWSWLRIGTGGGHL